MTTVTIREQRVGDTLYLPADVIEIDAGLQQGLLDERTVMLLRNSGAIGDETPETLRVAIARRPAGSPWPPRGYTESYLLEKGLISPEDVPGAPPAVEKKPTRPAAPVVTDVILTDEKIAVGEYFLQPKKRGNFVFFDAATADGRLLRDKAFKNKDEGIAFLQSLSTADAPSGSQEQTMEVGNGSDVRSDAGGGEG